MSYPVFWLDPTDKVILQIRRYTMSDSKPCQNTPYGHSASIDLDDESDAIIDEKTGEHKIIDAKQYRIDDERLRKCEYCDYVFTDDDAWSVWQEPVMVRRDTNERMTLRTAPIGAMWDAKWMGEFHRGPDGICLTVRTPGGDWDVDGRANNCGKKDEKWSEPGHHYCWVRHGNPRSDPPSMHVDKNGNTCNAGAGSIAIGNWHGFLDHGVLDTTRH
jgi:hypothetical protein